MLHKYFSEIKNRMFLIMMSWIVTVLVCYIYKDILLFMLIKLNRQLYNLESFYFISTNLTDVFSVYLQLSYFIGGQFAVFSLFYHVLIFLSPGLFKFEYEIVKFIFISCFLFLVISVTMLNMLILPCIWDFFLSLQNTSNINIFFEAQILEYFKFYKTVYFLSLLIGQSFVCILFILRFVKEKQKFVTVTRKFFFASYVVLATLSTPPDIISQILISFCFIVTYEFIVFANFLNDVFYAKNKNNYY